MNPDWDIPGGVKDPVHYENTYEDAVARGMPEGYTNAPIAGGWL